VPAEAAFQAHLGAKALTVVPVRVEVVVVAAALAGDLEARAAVVTRETTPAARAGSAREVRETARSVSLAAAAVVPVGRTARPDLRWEVLAATAATQSLGAQAEAAPVAMAWSQPVMWL
jgi:hypothetical protein